MTCDQGTARPERSSVVVSLPNGKEMAVNSNQPLLTDIHVGISYGPLTLKDNSPDELINGRFTDCRLIITNIRIEMSAAELARRSAEAAAVREKYTSMIQATKQDVELHRTLLMSLQSNLYFRTGQRNEMGCLIKTWSNDDLFADMVSDLKSKFAGTFGEFKDSDFDCTTKSFPQLTNEGMTCTDYTLEGVQKALRNLAISLNSRYFYETCSTEKSYLQLMTWYEEESSNLAAAIEQTRAAQLPDLVDQLETLRSEVSSIVTRTCSSEKCTILSVDVSSVPK
ncbi:MAG: hypothetical protein H7318_15710 [Oligoflexus sp.]|nr:hypothetical protein [Oligoflexus sp.]